MVLQSRKTISIIATLLVIALTGASLYLTLPSGRQRQTSSSTSNGTPAAQVERQLNPPLSVAWKFGSNYSTGGYGPIFNFISDGSNLYATSGKIGFASAYLVAVNLETGRTLWDTKIPGSPDAKGTGLSFQNNDSSTHTLVVGVAGALLAVDDIQGRKIWSVNGSEGFPIATSDGRVYTAVGAFWSKNGSRICSYQQVSPTQGEIGGWILAYGEGRIYSMVGSDHQKGALSAFDALSCKQLWTTPLGSKGNHWASYWSTYNGGRVYAADDHNLYAVDSLSGRILWNVTHGLQNFWPPAVKDGVVYLAGGAGTDNISGWKNTERVAAFNATDGRILWRSAPIVADSTVRPSVSGKVVYAALGCTLLALNSGTGKELWRWSSNGCLGPGWFAYYGPLISSSYLILSDDVGYLVAFRGNQSLVSLDIIH